MTFKFISQKLATGLYEPEGLYLHAPFAGEAAVLQRWGEHPTHYAAFSYNGIPLKGHPGVDFLLTPQTPLLAVDQARVSEIGFERGGFERYLKLEHRWGESFYAYVDELRVEAGQIVTRGAEIGLPAANSPHTILHFAIRVTPFNRLDGWGGFIDPLPFLSPSVILSDTFDVSDNSKSIDIEQTEGDFAGLHLMAKENSQKRRP